MVRCGRWWLVVAPIGFSAATWTSRAQAVDFDDRPLNLSGVLGAGSPVGLIGAIVSYSVVAPVSLGVGSGWNGIGPEFGALATFRLARRTWGTAHAFVLTAAYSSAPWQEFNPLPNTLPPDQWEMTSTYRSDWAHWISLEPGYELLARGGFSFRVSYGMSVMLNPDDTYCVGHGMFAGQRVECDDANTPDEGPLIWWPSLTIALGYAFEL